MNNHELTDAIYKRLTEINILDKEVCKDELYDLLTKLGVTATTTTAEAKENKPTAEERLISLVKACKPYKLKDFPNSVFYMKGCILMFEQNWVEQALVCSYQNLAHLFESEFNCITGKSSIVHRVENILKIEGYDNDQRNDVLILLEKALKIAGYLIVKQKEWQNKKLQSILFLNGIPA